MKIPQKPPEIAKIIADIFHNKYFSVNYIEEIEPVDSKGKYLHWDKLRYMPPPKDMTHESWWATLKVARKKLYQLLSINNFDIGNFKYCILDKFTEELHWLDKNAGGSLNIDEPVLNRHMKNTYLVSSLIEESITSSQLEGAATTRKIAKKMLNEGRSPKNKNEQMIYNNYLAMQFIRENKNESLTPEMIKELQNILTTKTLDDENDAGKYRLQDDDVRVVDNYTGETLFEPPPADQIEKRVKELCKFANCEIKEKVFIHPVIRSIIIHFLLAYIHPFIDGNGRTARALFYWSMLKHGYLITEFISISKIIKKSPAQYGNSFLYTETDENDLTYFIDHQIKIIHKAIDEFHNYVKKKVTEVKSLDNTLNNNLSIKKKLNHRQLTLIKHALKHPGYNYTIQEHKNHHGIVYETSRKDLESLAKMKLLKKTKVGKAFIYVSPVDLENRLKK